jgi:hypothetical protein
MRGRFAMTGYLALAAPALASAQTTAPRVYVSVNGGIQRSDNTVSQSFSVQKNFEDAPISVDIDEKSGVLVDGGVVFRLIGPIGMGFDLSVVTHDTDAGVTASVPHPFFFRQPRNIEGTTPATRREVAGHIQAVYLVPGPRLDVMIFGGPSLFSVRQTLVTDVVYSESFPFDTATFSSAQTATSTSKTAIGFNAGVDVTWKFSRNVGVGGMARFARAQATLNATNNAAMKVDAGGLLAGGGIRLAF